jgi:hypothetical protein
MKWSVSVQLVVFGINQNLGQSRVLVNKFGIFPCVLPHESSPIQAAADLLEKITGIKAKLEPLGTGWVNLELVDVSKDENAPHLIITYSTLIPCFDQPRDNTFRWIAFEEASPEMLPVLAASMGAI